MRVLIIESDLAFASTLRQALEARGVAVETTPDGKQGMELAQSGPTAAVVLAVELGDRLTGGFNWCNKFKRDDGLKSIPLLLTSSLATQQTFEQHAKLKTRADGYLLKPFGPDDLLDVLEPWLPDADPADEGYADGLSSHQGDSDLSLDATPGPEAEDDEAGDLLSLDTDDDEGIALDADGDDAASIGDDAGEGAIARTTPGAAGTQGRQPASHEIADDFDILAGDLLDDLEMVSAGPPIDASPPAPGPADGGTPWEERRAGAGGGNPWQEEPAAVDYGRIAELESRLAALSNDVATSRRAAEELQAQLAQAHTELAMTKGEATALHERLVAMEAELADGRDREALLARKLELEVNLRTELRGLLGDALDRIA